MSSLLSQEHSYVLPISTQNPAARWLATVGGCAAAINTLFNIIFLRFLASISLLCPFLHLESPNNSHRLLDLKETKRPKSFTFSFLGSRDRVWDRRFGSRWYLVRGGLLVSICRSLTPVVCVRFRPCMCVFETMLVMLCLQVLVNWLLDFWCLENVEVTVMDSYGLCVVIFRCVFYELLAVGIRNPFLVVLQVPFIALDFDSRVC